MERHIVKPPNEGAFKCDQRKNGFLPLTGSGSPVAPSNLSRFLHGDAGGSADLAHRASPVDPPNNSKFRNGDHGNTPAPPSAVQPGKGAVPVNPFLVSGGLVPAKRLSDSAKTSR